MADPCPSGSVRPGSPNFYTRVPRLKLHVLYEAGMELLHLPESAEKATADARRPRVAF